MVNLEQIDGLKKRIFAGETTIKDIDIVNGLVAEIEAYEQKMEFLQNPELDESREQILGGMPGINVFIEKCYVSRNDEE